MDPIRRISIRARGMSNAATTGRTHVSTRPYAQAKAKFSLASKGASTHVPGAPQTRRNPVVTRSANRLRRRAQSDVTTHRRTCPNSRTTRKIEKDLWHPRIAVSARSGTPPIRAKIP